VNLIFGCLPSFSIRCLPSFSIRCLLSFLNYGLSSAWKSSCRRMEQLPTGKRRLGCCIFICMIGISHRIKYWTLWLFWCIWLMMIFEHWDCLWGFLPWIWDCTREYPWIIITFSRAISLCIWLIFNFLYEDGFICNFLN